MNIEYHLDVEHHLYSVSYRLIHQTVDVRLSPTTGGSLSGVVRLWVHRRSHQVGVTTIPEHMAHADRAHLVWSPSRLIGGGATVGPHTTALVEQILASRAHPEQGYRSCLDLLRLAKQYGAERVEAASTRAVLVVAHSYRHVEAMLNTASIASHSTRRIPRPL